MQHCTNNFSVVLILSDVQTKHAFVNEFILRSNDTFRGTSQAQTAAFSADPK